MIEGQLVLKAAGILELNLKQALHENSCGNKGADQKLQNNNDRTLMRCSDCVLKRHKTCLKYDLLLTNTG